jgi:hypothetical protein
MVKLQMTCIEIFKEMMNSHFFVRADRVYTFANTLVPVQKKTLNQFKGCQIISLEKEFFSFFFGGVGGG